MILFSPFSIQFFHRYIKNLRYKTLLEKTKQKPAIECHPKTDQAPQQCAKSNYLQEVPAYRLYSTKDCALQTPFYLQHTVTGLVARRAPPSVCQHEWTTKDWKTEVIHTGAERKVW